MSRFLQVFYVFFSAAMLALAIPNELIKLGSPLAGFISLIPLYIAYSNLKSYKEASAIFALHTFLVHVMTSFWLAFFKDFAALTLGASAVGTGIIGGFIGLLMYLPAAASSKNILSESEYSHAGAYSVPFKVFWFAAVYTFYEWIKSIGWLGYPWGTISSAMFRLKIFIQIADITGTYGISFLAALFSAAAAEGLLLFGRKNSINAHSAFMSYSAAVKTTIALFALTFIYGIWQYNAPRKPLKYLNTITIQQNADPWMQVDDNNTILLSQRLIDKKLEECKAENKRVDLIVWSEGCLRYSFPNAKYHYEYFPQEEPLIPYIRKTGIPFIIGAPYKPDEVSERIFNAALLFDSEGFFRGAYGKNHLVPFAEAIPFSNIPAVRDFLKNVINISAGWVPGDQYVLFDVPAHNPVNRILPPVKIVSLAQTAEEQKRAEDAPPLVKLGVPICFDDTFPEVCTPIVKSGAELLMNLTDDSWSKLDSAEYQHFTVAAFRAIELRTTLARSTNAGFSAIVDPAGRIKNSMRNFTADSMFTSIPVYAQKSTVYMKFGNWLPKSIFLFIIVKAVYVFICIKNNKSAEPRSERKKLDRFRKRMLKKKRI